MTGHLTRRDFLRTAGVVMGGALAAPLLPANAAATRPLVALAQADDYDRTLIRTRVTDMLDQLGGLGDVVRPGDTVVIKTNLTGGVWNEKAAIKPAIESYVTHPEVVRALGEAVLDAGAGRLVIVEAVYDRESFPRWGHRTVAKDLGATLLDLNDPAPGRDFVQQPVGPDWNVYESFAFNRVLVETDVFMSVAKMKCHASCGVTHSMKNLVGLVPSYFYRLNPEHNHRSALHGPAENYRTRLPRVVVDLNRARPIHFALIDGVKTSQCGEGPWIWSWEPVQPGVLVAGKNAVATDAVATAAMGFDPATHAFAAPPFRYCLNHLQLASRAGLGPHTLDEIEIVGATLDHVRFDFAPYEAPPRAHEPHMPGVYGVV
jgi:uncharacterized protein (DUF362 family)